MSQERVINEIVASMYDHIPSEYLNEIKNRVSLVLKDYKIEPISTDLMVKHTYPDFMKMYFATMMSEGKSKGTLRVYKDKLVDFFDSVNKPIDEITTADVRGYLLYRSEVKKNSGRTVNLYRAAIRTFFEWAYNEEYITKNVCKNIKPIKCEVMKKKPLTGEEIASIRQAQMSLRDRAVIEFLYSTGCRIGEAIKVNISDIDFRGKEVVIYGEKTREYRTVYLTDNCIVAIKNYLNSRSDDNDALFIRDILPAERLTASGVRDMLKKVSTTAGIRHISPHIFRHTMATDALNRGMSITEVQQDLGHKCVQTTLIYAETDRNKLKEQHMRCIV